MKASIAALIVGIIFSVGLGLSGMTDPKNVVSFLDIFGEWNPSLIFVMGGALVVHMTLFRIIVKRRSPLFGSKFELPQRRDINHRLVIGSALFGIGWGLAGYCPAPAITAVASFSVPAMTFVVSMLIGMMLFNLADKRFTRDRAS